MRSPLSLNSELSPIGIDIGARTVKAAQVRRKSGVYQVENAAEFLRSGSGAMPDAGEIERIESILYRRGFRGGRAAIGVPRSEAMFEEIERPPIGEGVPADQIAASELARVRRLDAASIEHAWWELPSVGGRGASTTALAIAVQRAPIVDLIDQFESVGIDVIRAEPTLTALASLQTDGNAEDRPFTILVDAGWSGLSLGVMHEGVLVYERDSDTGGIGSVVSRMSAANHMDRDAACELLRRACSGADSQGQIITRSLGEIAGQIASEVEISLGYASHRYRDEARCVLHLSGGAAGIREVRERAAGIRGCALQPEALARVVGIEGRHALAGACALAVGSMGGDR